MKIHPTAIVHPKAEIGEGVEVGPYAFIGEHVKIGKGSVIHHHASVEGHTTMGEQNEVGSFSVIGSKPPGGSEHIIPARISRNASALAAKYAEQAHALLGCRGMSRVDMIVEGDQPWFLEINTIPGMTPTSLLPDAARSAGIPFPKLLDRIIEDALRGAPG